MSKFYQVGSACPSSDFANTKFFHNHARLRNHKSKIFVITDNAGVAHMEFHVICNCFLDFFDQLWTSSKPGSVSNLSYALPNDHNVLLGSDKRMLIRPMP